MRKKYATYTDKFKFKVALEALKENKTVPELCQEFNLAVSQIYTWKKQLKEAGGQVFSVKGKPKDMDAEVERLHTVIGKLKVENDFLAKALGH